MYNDILECSHEETRPTRRTKSNGTDVVTIQCLTCGSSLGEKPKRLFNVPSLPEWDQELQDRCNNQIKQAWKERAEQSRIERELQELQRRADFEEKRLEYKEDYHEYLESPHWKQLRRRVIVRDNFHCQNCFCHVTDATAQVHHLSYAAYQRLGKSFAFECVTLCEQCHKDYHGIAEVSHELSHRYQ